MDERMPTAALARLAPLPDGERRLRSALRERDTAVRGWQLPFAAACACLCLLAIAFALRPDPMDARIQQAIRAAVEAPDGVRITGARVESVESLDPAVRIYRVFGDAALSPAAGR